MREHLVTALDAAFLLVVGLVCLAAVVLIGLVFGPIGLLFVVAALLLGGVQIALGVMHTGAALDQWARRRLGV